MTWWPVTRCDHVLDHISSDITQLYKWPQFLIRTCDNVMLIMWRKRLCCCHSQWFGWIIFTQKCDCDTTLILYNGIRGTEESYREHFTTGSVKIIYLAISRPDKETYFAAPQHSSTRILCMLLSLVINYVPKICHAYTHTQFYETFLFSTFFHVNLTFECTSIHIDVRIGNCIESRTMAIIISLIE